MIKIINKIIILIYFLIFTNTFAANLPNEQYNATITVDSGVAANSQEVLKQGLAQVLFNITGKSDLDKNPVILQALTKPENYLLKYSIQTVEFGQEKQQRSSQSYAPNSIDSLLKAAGLNGANGLTAVTKVNNNKPVLLSWVFINPDAQNTQDSFVLSEVSVGTKANNYKAIIDQKMAEYKIRVVYPIQDLEEQSVDINPDTNLEQIKKLSERYNYNILLIGYIYDKSVKLVVINTESQREFIADSLEQAVDLVAQEIALLNKKNSQIDQQQSNNLSNLSKNLNKNEMVNIRINGINNLEMYTKIHDYLTSLPTIGEVKVNKLGDGWLDLSIETKSSRSELLKALREEGTFLNDDHISVLDLNIESNIESKPEYIATQWVSSEL